jgi:molecular chaperone GrpE
VTAEQPEEDLEAKPDPEPVLGEAGSAGAGPEAASESGAGPDQTGAGPASGEQPPPTEVLARVQAERDDYLRTLQQVQADFENYRKRIQRQQSESMDRAGEDLVVKLLVVLDNADLALAHLTDALAREPIQQLANDLSQLLGREGLEKINPEGEKFDPAEHEAIIHEEGDGEPVVTAVLRAGYRFKGRLLRPALVKVAG